LPALVLEGFGFSTAGVALAAVATRGVAAGFERFVAGVDGSGLLALSRGAADDGGITSGGVATGTTFTTGAGLASADG